MSFVLSLPVNKNKETAKLLEENFIIQWPTEGERESMDARMEAFEPIFATIEPKK